MSKVTETTRTVEDDIDGRPVVAATPVVTEDRDPEDNNVAERLIYIIGGTLLVLLAVRVLLSLLGANRANGFADFIYTVTYPFAAPFFGLFGYQVQYGVSRLEVETIVAILVYAGIMALIARLVALNRPARS
ncbi:MAG: YggT family protein [Candidatus Saccharimonadales bacterium]